MAFSLSRLCLLGAALLCVHSVQGSEPTPAAAPSSPDSELIQRGQYVAQLGDCIACHTAKGGATMAGGLELKTPMGTIYSSNITPDKDTGIGRYSFEAFDRAMREGVTPDGSHLYPAMPYPSYAKMTEEDMRALYAYLMHGVEPVAQGNLEADMGFPFNSAGACGSGTWPSSTSSRSSPIRPRTSNSIAALTWSRAWATVAPATPRGASPSRKRP